MTDTTDDAPERIFLKPCHPCKSEADWYVALTEGGTEYVRADIAPQRICDWCDETSLQRKARCPVKGCHARADLPATDEQVMDHPKVRALVEASVVAISRLEYSADTFGDQGSLSRSNACSNAASELRTALAAIQEAKP